MLPVERLMFGATETEKQREARKRAKHAAENPIFSGPSTPPVQRARGSMLGTLGLSSDMREPQPHPFDGLDLRSDVRKAAELHDLSSESARVLDLIAKRQAQSGGAVDFTRRDLAETLKLSHEQVDRVLGSLIQRGLVSPQSNRIGPTGYVVRL